MKVRGRVRLTKKKSSPSLSPGPAGGSLLPRRHSLKFRAHADSGLRATWLSCWALFCGRNHDREVRAVPAIKSSVLFSVSSYFAHLEGCGAHLHKEIRDTYYQFVLFLVKAVKGFSSISDRYCITLSSLENTLFLFLLTLEEIHVRC